MRQRLRQGFVEDTVPESRKATVPEKKERDIYFEQPLRDRDRGCHKPRSPTEIFDIGLVDRAWVAKPKPPDREYGSLCLKNASCLG